MRANHTKYIMALEEKIVKKHLYEWLLDHADLTIPQLGKFETTPTSASIQAGVYKFLPPNKKVTFHIEHDATDTALRNILMEREKLTPEQATYTITVFVQKVKQELATRQRYELEDFGLLSQLNENTIIFRIDEEANVAGGSYGLPGLYPKPLVHLNKDTETPTHINPLMRTDPDLAPYEEEAFVPMTNHKNMKDMDTITIEEKRVNSSSNTLLASILMILFLVSLIFVFLLITDTNPFWSGTADASKNKINNLPPKKEETKKEEPKKEEPKKEEQKPEVIDNTPLKSTKPNIDYTVNDNYTKRFAWMPNAPANLADALYKTRDNKSFVVLGSFEKAENAYSFYNNLVKRGVSGACMIAPVAGNTRYRVCQGKYNTQEEAIKAGLVFGKQNTIEFFVLNY